MKNKDQKAIVENNSFQWGSGEEVDSIRTLNSSELTDSIKKMCTTIDVIKLMEPEDIFPAYEKAFTRTDGRNTLIVEFGDYYNEK